MPIRLVPGFSQPASVWDDVIDVLAATDPDATVEACEVPDGLDFTETASTLAAGTREPATWVGYSLGGRLSLQLALDHPDAVSALVLVSATAGLADDEQRGQRAVQDETDARTIERDGAAAFLATWVQQPIFATLPTDRNALDARAAAMSTARLAHQMRALGQGAMPSAWERLGRLTVPVTVIVGAADPKYCAIGGRLVERLAHGELVILPGGHSLPLESPAPLAAAIARAHRVTRFTTVQAQP